jgi:hypothetical protein
MKRKIVLSLFAFFWISAVSALIAAEERPKDFHVSADGQGEYSSVQVAIDAAPAGAVVRIGPGKFQGPVQITKPLTLEGAGADRTFLTADWVNFHECLVDGKGVPKESQAHYQSLRKIAVEKEFGEGPVSAELWRLFGSKPTLTVKGTSDVIMRGLSFSMPGTVKAAGGQTFPMVLLDNAGATVEGCAFVGSAVDGVAINGVSTITMQKCLFGGIHSSGVVVKAEAPSKIQIEDCDVRGCGYAGFKMKGTGDVTVTHCRISAIKYHGIRYDNSSPTITGNVFWGIDRAGIYVDGETKGSIVDNLFFDCGTGSGNEDLIANNTFVRQSGPSPKWRDFAAISVSGTGEQIIRNNVVSGYDHALVLYSTDKKSLNRDNKKFEGNLCDTRNSPIVNVHSIEPKSSYEERGKPEIRELPLPEENWKTTIKFTDPEHGDYSLSEQLPLSNRNLGTRKHAALTSPWPEQPDEKAMLDRIKEAESKVR